MVEKVRAAISEKKAVSLSVVIGLIGLSSGFIAWTHSVEARVTKVEFIGNDLENHRTKDAEYWQQQTNFMHSIDVRLTRIEAILNRGK